VEDTDENSQDFSSKEYRELLINNLVKYSKENKIVISYIKIKVK